MHPAEKCNKDLKWQQNFKFNIKKTPEWPQSHDTTMLSLSTGQLSSFITTDTFMQRLVRRSTFLHLHNNMATSFIIAWLLHNKILLNNSLKKQVMRVDAALTWKYTFEILVDVYSLFQGTWPVTLNKCFILKVCINAPLQYKECHMV